MEVEGYKPSKKFTVFEQEEEEEEEESLPTKVKYSVILQEEEFEEEDPDENFFPDK